MPVRYLKYYICAVQL